MQSCVMLEVFRVFSSIITNQSRQQKLTAASTTGSPSLASDTAARASLEISLRSFSWLIFLDRLVAGLLVHTEVLIHHRLAWEIGRTVFADSFTQSILQQQTIQV